jgi:hypothetical protein
MSADQKRGKRRPRKLQTGLNGYYCISEDGHPLLQGEINERETAIWIGIDKTITIDKMFGPLVFFPIRVRADFEKCEWVIEREFGEDDTWREVARIPGQMESDFAEADE